MNPFASIPPDNCFIDFKRAKNNSLYKFRQTVIEEQRREEIVSKVIQSSSVADNSKVKAEKDEDALLAESLMEHRKKEFLEGKRRQKLRESSDELRELEKKLRAAYVAKALSAQKAERELLRAQEKALKAQEDEILEKARITFDENERIKEELEIKKKHKLREELKDQMQNNIQAQARKYQEFLDEKKIVDQIVRKVYEEQLQEMRNKVEKRIRIKQELAEFLEAQEMARKQQEANTDEENKELLAIIKEQQDRARAIEDQKLMKLQKRSEISDYIGKKISAISNEKRKKNDTLEDLLIEEKTAMNDRKFREKMESELRERIKVRMDLDMMRDDNARRKLEEQEEDRLYKEQLKRDLAEKDKLDLLSNERRRRKQMEHRRAIEQSLEERKRSRAKELTGLIKQRDEDLREDKHKQQLIEEERIKILKEHAIALLGYFPPGVLRETDRQHISSLAL